MEDLRELRGSIASKLQFLITLMALLSTQMALFLRREESDKSIIILMAIIAGYIVCYFLFELVAFKVRSHKMLKVFNGLLLLNVALFIFQFLGIGTIDPKATLDSMSWLQQVSAFGYLGSLIGLIIIPLLTMLYPLILWVTLPTDLHSKTK